jgi:lambda family phage portal protein
MAMPRWLTAPLRTVMSGFMPGDPAGGAITGPLGAWQFQQSPLEAGSYRSRRMWGFNARHLHVNSLIQASGQTTVARARWLVRNNGYAKQAVKAWAAAAVGTGIKPSSLIADAALKKTVAETWLTWTDQADAEAVTEFYGLQRRVAREAFLSGEAFVRLRPRRPEDGLIVPLQLQMLPSEQLPAWHSTNAANGNAIRMGIEFDAIGRRTAYWFLKNDPGDATIPPGQYDPAAFTRVPAEQVIHVFDPIEAGQIRGMTGYAAATVKLFMLDIYDDAELERKKQAARFAAFLKHPLPPQDLMPLTPTAAPTGGLGGMDASMVPSMGPLPYYGPGDFMELPYGTELEFSQPADVGAGYEPFQFRTLLQIGAALGVPYSDITGDLTKTSYASSRAGMLQFRGEVEAFQHAVMVWQFLRPVYNAWMDAAVLAGALPITPSAYAAATAKYQAFRAIPPKFPWVDPLKDRQAEALAVQNGFKARSDVIEAEGYDPEETDARIAADHAREEELGLDFTPSVKLATAPMQHIDPDAPPDTTDPGSVPVSDNPPPADQQQPPPPPAGKRRAA